MVKIIVKTFCRFFALIIKFPTAAWIRNILDCAYFRLPGCISECFKYDLYDFILVKQHLNISSFLLVVSEASSEFMKCFRATSMKTF